MTQYFTTFKIFRDIKMKKITTAICFVSAVITAQSVYAQTVDEIINEYITALGGKEKMLSLKTLKITGTNLNPQGNKVDVVQTHKHMVALRIDRNRNGTKSCTIATAKKGWITGFGETTPRAMDDDQLKASQARLDIQGALINYKEKGTKVELAGKEKIEGIDCFNLKVTFESGVVLNFYIDSKTYRISKISRGDNFTLFLNYKQNTDGYWFAYTNKQSNGAELAISTIETNIPVDDIIFQVD